MIEGVIFDLDGALVSTDKMHFQAWKRLAEEISITDFTKEDNKLQKEVVLDVGPEYRQLGADYESLALQSEADWDKILEG